MKTSNIISKSAVQLLLGIFIGVLVTFQSSLIYNQPDDKKTQQEKKSKKKNTEEAQVKLSEAVPYTPVQVNLYYQSFLVGELAYGIEELYDALRNVKTPFRKAFQIMFRVIISPNAP